MEFNEIQLKETNEEEKVSTDSKGNKLNNDGLRLRNKNNLNFVVNNEIIEESIFLIDPKLRKISNNELNKQKSRVVSNVNIFYIYLKKILSFILFPIRLIYAFLLIIYDIFYNMFKIIYKSIKIIFHCCDFSNDVHFERKARIYAIGIIIIFIFFVFFGFMTVLKYCEYEKSCIIHLNTFKDALWIAKSSGKLISWLGILNFVLVIRSITSSLNLLPSYRLLWMDWRKLHVYSAKLMIAMGIIHTIAHVVRIEEAKVWNKANEIFTLTTGCILWILLIGLILPYIIMKQIVSRKHMATFNKIALFDFRGLEHWAKSLFRHYHITFAMIFLIVYTIHGYQVWSLAAIVFWLIEHRIHEINTDKIEVVWTDKGEKDERIHLTIRLNDEVPLDYGIYYQLSINGIRGSFTAITADKNVVKFSIKRSIFTEYFNYLIKKGIPNRNVNMERVGKNEWIVDPSVLAFQMYGPYHSTDYLMGNSEHVIVLISGIGKTVSDSLIEYSQVYKDHWKSIHLVELGSSKEKNAPECNYYHNIDDLSKHLIDTSHPIEDGRKSTCSIKKTTIYGRYTAEKFNECLEVLLGHEKTFDFLICGNSWDRILKDIEDLEDSVVVGNDILRFHQEDFSI